MVSQPQISYRNLRKINPKTARMAVLEYLSSNGNNISQAARMFGVHRLTIYNILIKSRLGDLKDRSRAPGRIANKTPPEVEKKIIKIASRTGLGAKRLQKLLSKRYKIEIAYGTLRGILRRNQG